jgi:hypothetical protein
MPQKDTIGRTLYHLAAQDGHLDKIPEELLTEDHLLHPGECGYTCFHYATKNGHLDQIPKERLTKKNLLQPDKHGPINPKEIQHKHLASKKWKSTQNQALLSL